MRKTFKPRPAKMTDNPIVGKLLKLKYRINDAYRAGNKPSAGDVNTRADKDWVMKLISEVRDNDWTELSKEDMLLCNSMWRKYE